MFKAIQHIVPLLITSIVYEVMTTHSINNTIGKIKDILIISLFVHIDIVPVLIYRLKATYGCKLNAKKCCLFIMCNA